VTPTGDPRALDPRLDEVLGEARDLGFLGPGPVAPQIAHARGFAATQARAPESFLDLGSGGGLPGLVLALTWPHAAGVLVEAMVRRAEFLERACHRLGLIDRIRVRNDRAETAAREPGLREQFELVAARSFGTPAVTAECGAGFLRLGGRLVVSEPPEDDPLRWPAGPLGSLGLHVLRHAGAGSRFVVMERRDALPEAVPRRVGVPSKRPLW
jgi:16S rRNA (guanine527-N7)-methyltransferase